MRDKFEVVGDAVCLPNGEKIPLRYFPCLRDEWESKNPTIPCEKKGAALARENFADDMAMCFLERVWEFVGMSANRIKGKIRNNESFKQEVFQCIKDAHKFLKHKDFKDAHESLKRKYFKDAFKEITRPTGLGNVCGSAILRMLHPEKGAMHSKKIVEWKWGNYPCTSEGWYKILGDYEKVADELNEKRRRIKNPVRDKWFVGDVAAAMWQWQNSFGNNGGDSAVVKE